MSGLPFQANASKSLSNSDGQRCLLLLVAPTHQRVRVKRITVSAKGGVQADKPARVVIASTSDDGTLDTLDLKLVGPGGETIQTAGWQHKASGHANPTLDTTAPNYHTDNVLPFGGRITYVPVDREGLLLKGGQMLGVFVTPDAAASVAATFDVTADCEE
jgi:hypothetical protein